MADPAEVVSCWAFEVSSIQSYLFETGRLVDAVGSSLLIDRLTGDLDPDDERATTPSLLSCVMDACEAPLEFSRRSGGAFIAFHQDPDVLERVQMLWHLCLRVNAPGLRFADGMAAGRSKQRSRPSSRCDVRARSLRGLAARGSSWKPNLTAILEDTAPSARLARTWLTGDLLRRRQAAASLAPSRPIAPTGDLFPASRGRGKLGGLRQPPSNGHSANHRP